MGCIESKTIINEGKNNLPSENNRFLGIKPSLTIIHDNEPDDIILLWAKVAEAMYFDVHLVSLNMEKLSKTLEENQQQRVNEKQTHVFQDSSSTNTVDTQQSKKNAHLVLLQNQMYSNVLIIQEVLAGKLSGLTMEIVLVDMRNSKYDPCNHSICHYFRVLYPFGSDTVLVALISKTTSGPGIKFPNDSIPSEVILNGFNKYFVSSNNLSSIVRELFIFNCNEISYLRKLRSQSNSIMFRPSTINNLAPYINKEGFNADEASQISELKSSNIQTSSAILTSERMKTILETDEKKKPDEAIINPRSIRNSIVSGSSSVENAYYNRYQQKRLSSSANEFPTTDKINFSANRKKWSISFINRMTNYILNEREFKLRLFQTIKRPRRNKRSSSSDLDLEKTLSGRRKESWARVQSFGMNSSLSRIIQVLQNAQLTCNPQASKELQSALDILLSNDLFCGILKYDQSLDKTTDEVIAGLLTNVDRQRQQDRRQAKKSVVNLSVSLKDIPKAYQEALENDDKWDFDVINLERVTDKKPLLYLGMKIFSRFDICEFLKCSQLTANYWLTLIEQNYHASNTYHNSTHAADVMQSCAYLLQKEILVDSMTQEDIAATILAAIIHDVDHPGKTNQFLVITKDRLALLYNDIAVLENHHASHAFKLTLENEVCNIFSNLDAVSFKSIRSQMINLVLATELSVHNNHLSQFISVLSQPMFGKLNSQIEDNNSINSQLDLFDKPQEIDLSLTKSQLNRDFLNELLKSEENKMILKRMIIKCSDVNNPTRKLELCKLWAERIANEYFDQTDEEICLGFENLTMPPFNRKTCNLAFTQVRFIEFFLMKMFPALDSVLDCPELISNFEVNLKYWQNESEASVRTI